MFTPSLALLAAAAALPVVFAWLLFAPRTRQERRRTALWLVSLLPLYGLIGLDRLPVRPTAETASPSPPRTELQALESPPPVAEATAPGTRELRLVERPPPDDAAIRARIEAQDAIETDPRWIAARDELRALYRAGSFEALVQAAEDEVLRFPDALEAHALAGLAHARLGHVDEAREHLNVVVERAENDPDYRMALLALRMIDPHDQQAVEGEARGE